MDNPYVSGITFILSTRLIYKLDQYILTQSEHMWESIASDCVLVSILLYVGVIPQQSFDFIKVALYTIQGLSAGIAISRLIVHLRGAQKVQS